MADSAKILVVDVQDTGIGIPAEEQEHIFEEFYRTKEAKTMEVVGTGLGLAIAKRVAEPHQGQIALQSKVGEGTTFTVTLPASEVS